MKITFVASGSEQLGITLLANLAKEKGHDVKIAFSAALFRDQGIDSLVRVFDDTSFVLETIKEQAPNILAFSALTASFQWMLHIAREAKKNNPSLKTIFGGVHVSAVPEIAVKKKEIDYIVVGEGEIAFLDIIDAIENKDFYSPIRNTRFINPKGSVVRGEQLAYYSELDSLPYFTKELWEGSTIVNDFVITMASRGCPYRCTFCFNNFFAELPDNKKNRGKYVRMRSSSHVIEELKLIKRKYKKVNYIDFEDDIFTVNKDWLFDFLQKYKQEVDIPFQCLSHPKYMDDEIAQWLKDAGCQWVQMGIQTIDDDFKNQNLKRYEKLFHIENAVSSILNAKLKLKVDHMLGLPGEPIEAQENARKLYAVHCPSRIQVFWTCFLPGTQLLDEGIQMGIVSKEQKERLDEGIDFFFFNNPENIKDKELVSKYEGYELLFKLYPILPRFIRIHFKEEHVRWIPSNLKRIMGLLADLINATVKRNPDITSYIRYYFYHSKIILKKKIKNKVLELFVKNENSRYIVDNKRI